MYRFKSKERSSYSILLPTVCYEQKSVIVTSNLEFGQWNRIFGDNRLTSALVDRLVSIMPTLLHLREKAIVYAMRCLLETLKLLFKKSSR
jgi:DNA replication protein DnaC